MNVKFFFHPRFLKLCFPNIWYISILTASSADATARSAPQPRSESGGWGFRLPDPYFQILGASRRRQAPQRRRSKLSVRRRKKTLGDYTRQSSRSRECAAAAAAAPENVGCCGGCLYSHVPTYPWPWLTPHLHRRFTRDVNRSPVQQSRSIALRLVGHAAARRNQLLMLL